MSFLTTSGTETLTLRPVLLLNRYNIFVSQLWRNQFFSKSTRQDPEQKAWGYNNTTIVITVAMATWPLDSICIWERYSPSLVRESGWLCVGCKFLETCNSNFSLTGSLFVGQLNWTICLNYLPELSAWTICLNYLPELSARTICLNYPPELSARTICLNYPPELSAWTVYLNYLPELSAWTICLNYPPELPVSPITIIRSYWCYFITMVTEVNYSSLGLCFPL